MNAAKIAGMDRRKENSPAALRSRPENRDAEMVIPERDIPGKTPIP
jgi:hypothetical protein